MQFVVPLSRKANELALAADFLPNGNIGIDKLGCLSQGG